ncbi:MAG TPA: acetylornithine transaminase [Acidimicrobiales bacterium]|nr:acetylornithine transaminase [Acidimicrobiales bacterium]
MSREALMTTYAEPAVTFVRGRGTELWDTADRRYLDFLTGLAVCSLGHAHPRVTEAVCAQAGTLLHVSNLFGNELAPRLAEEIDALIGDGTRAGGRSFFCNSGAEANECAIKLARKWGGRGRHVVLSAYGSFHGRTLATLHATGQPAKHEPFVPLPEGFRHVAWGEADALADAMDPSVAAVMLESVQGEGGVNPAPPGYLADVRRLCDERGAVLILDEVQTGLGRTGRWFGFHHDGVVPDIVTMAKALGNGVPIGACWARAEVAAAFQPGDHATTFGGQPLAVSAALATLAVMQEEDAPRRARQAGAALSTRLGVLPGVREVRGRGLLLAAVLERPLAKAVVDLALDRGLVLNAVAPDAIRLAPPLLVTDDEIDEACGILSGCLAEVLSGTPA